MKIGLEVPKGVTLKGELRHRKDAAGNFLYDDQNNPVMGLAPESQTRAKEALALVGLPAVIRARASRSAAPRGGIAYNRRGIL